MNRYGVLTRADRLRLLVGYLVLQPLAWLFFDGMKARMGIALLTGAVLAVVVATRRRSAP